MAGKRILLIASSPLANDGITKVVMAVIKAYCGSINFEVACCLGFNNRYGAELAAKKITCHTLPQKKKPLKYMSAIRKLVKQEKYDSVYIHGNSAMMFLESIPSKIAGAQVITHCHNTRSAYPVVHYLLKPFFNLSVDKKIGCSSLASRWAYCGKNVITIPNGVELDRFTFNAGVREKTKEGLEWTDQKIVGHIGRLDKQKNHARLINIFDKMRKMDDHVRLLLVGDGVLYDEIVNAIAIRHLTDYVKIIRNSSRLQDYMQAMDVMILPSLYEGLCLVALEAQANGLPVLVNCSLSPET